MEIHTVSLIDALADGQHERCAFCNRQFPFTDGKLIRVKALDGWYYCSNAHASAGYVREDSYALHVLRK